VGGRIMNSESVAPDDDAVDHVAAGTNRQPTQLATLQEDIPAGGEAADEVVCAVAVKDHRPRLIISGVVHAHRAIATGIGDRQAVANASQTAVQAYGDIIRSALAVHGQASR